MRALQKINLQDVVFIDIETVRLIKDLEIDTPTYDAWEYKVNKGDINSKLTSFDIIESYTNKAALYAEFAKIVCISVGRINGDDIKIRTYNNTDEKILLEEFNKDLNIVTSSNKKTILGGHAIIGFDIPFIFKRCIINGIDNINEIIDVTGLKPWEVNVLDTKDIWRGTSFEASSLLSIVTAFGLPSPKDDITGSQVGEVYYSDDINNIERISYYCEKDVRAVADVVRLFKGLKPLNNDTNSIIQTIFEAKKITPIMMDKLKNYIKEQSEEEQSKIFDILDAAVSNLAGKKTKFTKEHVKEIKESL